MQRNFVMMMLVAALPFTAVAQPPRTPDLCANPQQCGTGPANVVHLYSSATVQLKNGLLDYQIRDVMQNIGGRNAEVDYRLPLPRFSAFDGMSMSIAGEMISGEILPATLARNVYETIVRTNRDPALVEWLGPRLFRTRIFPIFPAEKKEVELRMRAVAQRDHDGIQVDYFVGTSRGRAASSDGTPVSMTFSFPDSAHYGTPYSSTHSLGAVTRGRGIRTVTATGSGVHIKLTLPIVRAYGESIDVIAHARTGEPGYALITLRPPVVAPRHVARDVVLLVDRNQYNRGADSLRLGEAAVAILSALRAGDRFGIVNSLTPHDSGAMELHDVSAERREAARVAVMGVKQSHHFSPVHAANLMMNAFSRDPSRRAKALVVLSDGASDFASAVNAILEMRQGGMRDRIRVMSVAVDNSSGGISASPAVLPDNGSTFVLSASEQLSQLTSFIDGRSHGPMVTDIRLRADGVVLEEMNEGALRDLYAGEQATVVARFTGARDATFTFDAMTADGPVRWSRRVDLPASELGVTALPSLWAAQQVSLLTSRRASNCGKQPALDAAIAALGEKYSVPTTENSYLILEPGIVIGENGQVLNAADFVAGRAGAAPGAGRGGGPPPARSSGEAQAVTDARTPLEVLQGRVAALAIRDGAGPGSDAIIQIRNPLSIAGYTQPMIIIDGVIQMQNDPSIAARRITGDIVGLNGDNVESIEVIRGAAAASLYGDRAANGVIVVTTKHGATAGGPWFQVWRGCQPEVFFR